MAYNIDDVAPNNEADIRELANDIAEESPCLSRKVGCVLILDNRIIGLGWNEAPPLLECKGVCRKKSGGMCYAIHAEVAAVIDAFNRGELDLEPAILYTSNIIPCIDCQKLLAEIGISEVVCDKLEFYDGADLFWKMKIINFREYKL